MMGHRARRAAVAITSIATVTALALSGCTPSGNNGGGTTTGPITDEQREEALNAPTELTFWTWVPDIQDQVDLFEKKYPAIKVKI